MSRFSGDLDYGAIRLVETMLAYRQQGKVLLGRFEEFLSDDSIRVSDSSRVARTIPMDSWLFAAPEIGYVNVSAINTAVYLSRMPIRRDWRQGLRSSQYHTEVLSANSSQMVRVMDGFNVRDVLRTATADVEKALNNEYPRFDTAVDMVEEFAESVAISRHFALSRNFDLILRGKILVAKVREDNRIELLPSRRYLIEQLQEETGLEVQE